MSETDDNSFLKYTTAIAAVAAAIFFRLLCDPVLSDRLPFITLFAAVVFVAWSGGRGPAIVTLALGLAAVAFFVVEPRYSLVIAAHSDVVGLVFFAAIGAGCILLFEQLRGARRRAEENTAEARRQAQQAQLEAKSRQAAEFDAVEQRERLQVTVASIGDGVITTDPVGRVTFLNHIAETLTGWTVAEAAGVPLETVFQIINESTRQPVENPALRSLREGQIVGLANHTLLISKDGSERPIDDSAAPIRSKNGDILGSVLVFRDISERKRSENALKEQMRLLALNAAVGTALVEANDLPTMLRHCAAALVTHLDAAFARIWTLNSDENCLELRASAGLYTHLDGPHSRVPVGKFKIGLIAQERKPHLTNAVVGDPRVSDQNWAQREGMIAFAGYPLVVDDRLVGVVAMFAKRELSNTTLDAMASVANEIAVGIERKFAEQKLRASEARTRAVLETALDCIIMMDHEGNVVEFNRAAENTFGYDRDKVIGRELAELIIPDAWRVQHRQGMAHYLATGIGPVLGKRLELFAMRADGSEFPVELAITRIPTDGPPIFTAYLRDISDRVRTEQHRNARLAVTHALSEAATADEAIVGFLRALCESLGWNAGFFWKPDDCSQALSCVTSWHIDAMPVPEFESASRARNFKPGEGLPGKVWATGKAQWLPNLNRDAYFPRAEAAAKYGWHSAVACPVVVNDQIIGVIEFFTDRNREPDASLLELFGTVAANFGQFLVRKAAEENVRQSEEELADFFDNATVGLHWVSSTGIILRANHAELEMLGYTEQEYIGRPIAEFHADQEVIADILERLQAGQQLLEYPARLQCKDGSIKDVLIDSNVMVHEGKFVHTRCFTRDVTQRKKAEAELREAQRRFQAVFNQQFQFTAILDPRGTVIEANETCFRATGFRRDQVLGRLIWETPWWDGLPTIQERLKSFVSQTIQSRQPISVDLEYTLANGSMRHATAVLTAVCDENGSITSIIFEGHDVTERRHHESELLQSEERLRLALDAGRMGVWDWNIRTGDLKWSDSLEPLHGLAPGTFGGTFEDFQKLIHPDDREIVNEAIRVAVEQRAGYDIEFRNIRANGGIHWIAGKGKVFVSQDGQPGRMIGIGMDVTERKRSEQTARFLADASAALAVLVDFDSTLQKVASLAVPHFADWATVDLAESDGSLRRVAVAHGDPAKVELGHEVHRRFPPDPDAPQGVCNILRTGESELITHITDELLVQSTKDGELLSILRELGLRSYIGVPLRVRGKTLGVLTFIAAESGHLYDSTDLAVAQDLASRAAIAIENAQLYRELRDADRKKDEFLATLAHELRNPLAPIRNGLQVLRLADADGETAVEARSMMERQLNQMVRLVDDLLDVSRITRNKLELRRQRVELAAVIESAVETSRPLIEQAGHAFSVCMPAESVILDADLTRLAQVFSNLLNNSAKYTEPGGNITLAAEVEGRRVVVKVRDTGLGIPPEALPRIFEMFSQVDRNMERSQGGLGIGLTLVRRLIEMHGGSVEAHSEGSGRGTEFRVVLPLASQQSVESKLTPKVEISTSKRRILIVDDNQDAARSLGMILKIMGNETHIAHDGLAAVSAAEQFRPEIILLDIGLPKLNGYEACRQIRAQQWASGMIIVALTGWGQEDDRRRSRDAGFDHHFVKPVEISSLQQLWADRQ